MTLRLSNNTLTRYVDRSGYAAAENVPLTGDLAAAFDAGQIEGAEQLTDEQLAALTPTQPNP